MSSRVGLRPPSQLEGTLRTYMDCMVCQVDCDCAVFGECHALCFIENRKGISQIYLKIGEFVQFIHFLAKLRYYNSFASILV